MGDLLDYINQHRDVAGPFLAILFSVAISYIVEDRRRTRDEKKIDAARKKREIDAAIAVESKLIRNIAELRRTWSHLQAKQAERDPDQSSNRSASDLLYFPFPTWQTDVWRVEQSALIAVRTTQTQWFRECYTRLTLLSDDQLALQEARKRTDGGSPRTQLSPFFDPFIESSRAIWPRINENAEWILTSAGPDPRK